MNKKYTSLVLAGLMCFSSITPAFAYDLDSFGNSIEEIEYQNTNDADYSNQTNVFAELGSEYKVTIPKTIVLSGVTKSAEYKVSVSGDIAGYETVNVIPDEEVTLSTKNKTSQTGTITQDKTAWKVSDFDTDANGTVQADNLTAGKWSGTFNFNIYMDSHEEMVLGDLVLPPVGFSALSPAQVKSSEVLEFKVGESGNIDVTYENEDVAKDSTITSSNEDVVKVDKNRLTAVGEGTATITVEYDTAKSGNDEGIKSYSFNVKVTKDVADKSLTVDTGDLAMGANASHEVHAFYDNEDVTDKVNWSSNNSEITVVNGLITTSASAQVGDTATITASTDDTSTLVAALDKLGLITVASAEDESDSVSFTVTIIDINFDDSDGNEIDNVSILPGENKSIRAKIVPETTGTVVWSCTAPSGITLQKNGNDVTIYVANDMPEGRTYNIVAIYGDYAKTITLNIASTAKDNLSVSIEDGNTLTVGDVKTINVTTTDNTTPSNVTITSSDENVARIVDGKIEAVGAGNATITISADGSVAKTINILVEQAQTLAAGLYDVNDNLIKSWDELLALGLNIEKDYSNKSSDSSCFFYNSSSGDSVFTNNNLSGKLVIHNSVTKIGNYAFCGCKSLTSVTIPDSVTTIGKCAFLNCTSLKSIKIPNSVTTIGERAFQNCTSSQLKSIKIPNSVTTINDSTFYGCKSLTSIIIPDSVTTIGISAFERCTRLASITIPDSVTTIGNRAFLGCTSLASITIPDSVTKIGNYAFQECTSLTSITIPDSVTTIGENAFYRCTSLTSITYKGTKVQWNAIGKGSNYNKNVPTSCVVHCTDGDTKF